MGLTTDRNSPCLNETDPRTGQQLCYLVLSEEERARGFVRPVRASYKHVGIRPTFPTRPLTEEEQERFAGQEYVAFEPYPQERRPSLGRFWTQEQLNSGCGVVTTMARELAETYAREPKFYGATFCCHCGRHIKVEEFEWIGANGLPDGSRLGE